MTTSQAFLSVFAQKEKERFKLKTGVFLFLIQNEQVLLLRRYRTGIDDGLYVVPMGGHDGNEPLSCALLREAMEEANISLRPEDVQVCHVMHRFHAMPNGLSFEQMDVFFLAHVYEGTLMNREPHKCDELKFFSLKDLPENMAPFIRYALTCTLSGQFFSEFGWDQSTCFAVSETK